MHKFIYIFLRPETLYINFYRQSGPKYILHNFSIIKYLLQFVLNVKLMLNINDGDEEESSIRKTQPSHHIYYTKYCLIFRGLNNRNNPHAKNINFVKCR